MSDAGGERRRLHVSPGYVSTVAIGVCGCCPDGPAFGAFSFCCLFPKFLHLARAGWLVAIVLPSMNRGRARLCGDPF